MEEDREVEQSSKQLLTETGLVVTQYDPSPETQEVDHEDDLAFPLSRVKKLMMLATTATVKLDSAKLVAKATVRDT